jgi:hypothetical protein
MRYHVAFARNALRAALVGLVGLGLVAVVAAGVLVLRLMRGPLRLDFLKPRLESALSAPDGSLIAKVGSVELVWQGLRRGIDLRASDLRAFARDGSNVATVPALSVWLGLEPLLHGELAATHVKLVAPLVRAVLEEDGRLSLGLGDEVEPNPENPMVTRMADDLTSRSDGSSPAAWLREVDVERARLLLDDRTSGLAWEIPALDASLRRERRAIVAALGGDVAFGERAIGLAGKGRLELDGGGAVVEVELHGMNPAALATALASRPDSPLAQRRPQVVEALRTLDMSLDATIRMTLDGSWSPRSARLEVTGAPGSLVVPALYRDALALAGLTLEANLDRAANQIDLERLSLDLSGPRLDVHGSLKPLETPMQILAEVKLDGLPVDSLGKLWPEEAARGAREWIVANVSRGRITAGEVRVRGELGKGDSSEATGARDGPGSTEPTRPAPDDRKAGGLRVTEVDGSLRFEGLQVRYLPSLPPATGIAGSGTFSQAGWKLGVTEAAVGDLRIGAGKVVIQGLDARAPRITIDVPLGGPLATLLRLLRAPPLGLAIAPDVRLEDVAGQITGDLHLDFPLVGRVDLENLGLAASAKIDGVAVPHLVQGWSIDGGSFDVRLGAQAVELSGRAALEGSPITVKWQESLLGRGAAQRTAVVSGTVDAAGRAALGFDTRPQLDGPVQAEVRLQQAAAGGDEIAVTLDLAPARVDVPELGVRKPAGADGKADASLLLEDGKVAAVEHFQIAMASCNVHGRAKRNGNRWSTIEASGTIGEAHQGAFSLTVAPAARGETFRLTSADVAAFLRALNFRVAGRGGELNLEGSIDVVEAKHAFDGRLEVKQFTLTEAPALAKIIQLASLSGIRETFSRSGIPIDRLTARLSGDVQKIEIREAVLDTSSFALMLDGKIDRVKRTCSFAGTIVPDYYGINPTLSRVPLLGSLLGNGQGKGVLGIDFSITGDIDEPKVSVETLRSVTPGALRNLTRVLGEPLRGGRRSSDRPQR